MSWPFETSEALVTPEQIWEHHRSATGISREDDLLPPLMVATFQRLAFGRLCERAGATPQVGGHGGSGFVGERAVGTLGGHPIVVQRITVGAPAAALVMEGAIVRGVRTLIVVGSAGSLQPSLPIGSTVVVEASEREDGTSHHYLPVGEVVTADPELTRRLYVRAMERGIRPVQGRSWTIDAPYRETVGGIRRHWEAGVLVVEMEAAAMFAVARVRNIQVGLLVAVSDELYEVWRPGFTHPPYLEALVSAADTAMDVASDLFRSEQPPTQ